MRYFFVWAALITKELGSQKATEFLNAHEDEDEQPLSEKEMDIANNNAGSEFAITQEKNGTSLEIDVIEKEGLSRLKQGKLKVISPSKKKIPKGYHSE